MAARSRTSDRLRILLLLPSMTYRTDFVDAAQSLGVEIVVASNFRQAMEGVMGDRALVLDFSDPETSATAICDLYRRDPFDAVIGVDEQGVTVAALSSQRLGLRHSSVEAVMATRNKAVLRERLAAGDVTQPRFALVSGSGDDAACRAAVDRVGGLPVVCKPVSLSGSQGVIRVDNASVLAATVARIRTIACDPEAVVLVEQYVPGIEVALEGLLRNGHLDVLAVFDKPDPLVGPYFEETIYVTPSRHSPPVLDAITREIRAAVRAIGLDEGPVHAEVRVDVESGETATVWVIEVAGRSIGGLCSRSLRFGLGVSIEQLILRHALGLALPSLRRERPASGVFMIPIPRAGVLNGVDGADEARAIAGIDGVEITVPRAAPVVPLPEGDRYLGFIFARGATSSEVEDRLRAAHACLRLRWADEPHASQ